MSSGMQEGDAVTDRDVLWLFQLLTTGNEESSFFHKQEMTKHFKVIKGLGLVIS